MAHGALENKKYARLHVYLFFSSIVIDRYLCNRAVVFFSDIIDACVFGLYSQRSLSLHSGVGPVACTSDVYRCFHVKFARTAIGIAAIARLRLSVMAIAACLLILCANGTTCLELFSLNTCRLSAPHCDHGVPKLQVLSRKDILDAKPVEGPESHDKRLVQLL